MLKTPTVAMEWRVCPRFPDYEVSECGDVRLVAKRITRRIGTLYRGFTDTDGYLRYQLRDASGSRRAVAAHVLVAEAFIGPKPGDDYEVAHNNGSRVMHRFDNLRWAVPVDNSRDMETHGTARKGENNGHSKVLEEDVHDIRRAYRLVKAEKIKGGLVALEQKYGLHRSTIISIAMGESWSHVPFTRADRLDDE